jgi:hypothetical protein
VHPGADRDEKQKADEAGRGDDDQGAEREASRRLAPVPRTRRALVRFSAGWPCRLSHRVHHSTAGAGGVDVLAALTGMEPSVMVRVLPGVRLLRLAVQLSVG